MRLPTVSAPTQGAARTENVSIPLTSSLSLVVRRHVPPPVDLLAIEPGTSPEPAQVGPAALARRLTRWTLGRFAAAVVSLLALWVLVHVVGLSVSTSAPARAAAPAAVLAPAPSPTTPAAFVPAPSPAAVVMVPTVTVSDSPAPSVPSTPAPAGTVVADASAPADPSPVPSSSSWLADLLAWLGKPLSWLARVLSGGAL